MVPIFDAREIGKRYRNEWVVLDRSLNVRDHGPQLSELQEKHGPKNTYYFVPAPAPFDDGHT
ncbi:MAG: hypothetical protein HY925_10765 [Elusimicrobia bacterium]|nr:hypothetical protein [Elusimicrobiota bacterium]